MIRTCYARIVDSAEAVRGVMETIVDGKNGKKDIPEEESYEDWWKRCRGRYEDS